MALSLLSRISFRLPIVGVRHHHGARIYFGNPEVAAEMDQIQRTQIAGDFDHVDIAGAARENGEAVNVRAGEV